MMRMMVRFGDGDGDVSEDVFEGVFGGVFLYLVWLVLCLCCVCVGGGENIFIWPLRLLYKEI